MILTHTDFNYYHNRDKPVTSPKRNALLRLSNQLLPPPAASSNTHLCFLLERFHFLSILLIQSYCAQGLAMVTCRNAY